jgi:Caspase domain
MKSRAGLAGPAATGTRAALRLLLGACVSLLLAGCARAPEQSQSSAAQPAAIAQAGHRLALVIGNDSYQHADMLHNARADARAVAAVLRSLGFTVTLKQDATYEQMKQAMRDFKASVAGGDEVVFYFSGHGVQFGGSNYLIPVDLTPQSEEQIADDSLGLQRVLDDLSEQKARFSLAIIDACRDNPFKGTGRAIGKRGLVMQSASGQMIMYSAGAGQEALDRLGASDHDPNGLFTRVLIKEIKRPGVTANQLLKDVSSQVVELARSVNHEQVPSLYDQSIGNYYFVPAGGAAVAQAQPTSTAAPSADGATVHVATADELEQEYWDRIRDSTDAADFRDYQKQFPGGPHAAEAALQVRRLTRTVQKSSAVAAVSGAAAPVARAAPLPAPAATSSASAPQASAANAVAPGSYAGYTTDSSYPGMKVLGRLMLASSGEFEYHGETGAVLHGMLDLSRPDEVSGRAVVRLPNGSSTGVMIRGKISAGKLVARYQDGWRDTGDIVFDLANPL